MNLSFKRPYNLLKRLFTVFQKCTRVIHYHTHIQSFAFQSLLTLQLSEEMLNLCAMLTIDVKTQSNTKLTISFFLFTSIENTKVECPGFKGRKINQSWYQKMISVCI